jgi:hypothetical protein
MLEAIIIIVALGGLEVALWWADQKRQEDQLATLEAIWVELALLNEARQGDSPHQGATVLAGPGSAAKIELPLEITQASKAVAG